MGLQLVRLMAMLGVAATAIPAWAADPAATPAPIKGSTDAMGDKGRSGPDGWSWAPQTREQAPADKSTQAASARRSDANSQLGPDTAKTLKPGDDPGTPVTPDSHGPGTLDSAATRKP